MEEWNYRESKKPRRIATEAVRGARYGPDPSSILTWENTTARVINTTARTPIPSQAPHGGRIVGGTFNADASWVLTWSEDGAWVWDAKNGHPLTTRMAHENVNDTLGPEGAVNGAMVSSDEQRVLTWSEDGTVRLWDLNANNDSPKKTLRIDHEIRTGSQLDKSGEVKPLTAERWQALQACRLKLEVAPMLTREFEWIICSMVLRVTSSNR